MFAFLYHALFSLYLSLSTRFYIRILTPSTTRWLMRIRRLIPWKIQAHDESAIERFLVLVYSGYDQCSIWWPVMIVVWSMYYDTCLHADPPTSLNVDLCKHILQYNFHHTSWPDSTRLTPFSKRFASAPCQWNIVLLWYLNEATKCPCFSFFMTLQNKIQISENKSHQYWLV